MKEYLQLQFKMLNRRMIDFGLPLLFGYTLIPVVFVFGSFKLFEKTEFAVYIYCLLALSLISKLNEPKRNDFLKFNFNKKEFRILRFLENLICCIPFTLFLIYQREFLYLMLLNLAVIGISFFNFSTKINLIIPTPFGKKPFEFTVGFRNTFYIFPIAYFLTYISVSVGNFNLGAFSLLVIGVICFSYYLKAENEYFVWNYNLSPKEFLLEKLRICLFYFSLLCLPTVITLSIFFFNQIDILFVVLLLCYVYLIVIILVKYSSFPNDINISQWIIVALSFTFPPIILVLIPVFYLQSIKSLNSVLND